MTRQLLIAAGGSTPLSARKGIRDVIRYEASRLSLSGLLTPAAGSGDSYVVQAWRDLYPHLPIEVDKADSTGPCDPVECDPGHRKVVGKGTKIISQCPAANLYRNGRLVARRPTMALFFPWRADDGTWALASACLHAKIVVKLHDHLTGETDVILTQDDLDDLQDEFYAA